MDYYDTLITTLSDDDLSSMDAYPSTAPPTAAVQSARVLRLYDIFIPMLGVFIILLNLMVVVSSGLILKRGKWPDPLTYLCGGPSWEWQSPLNGSVDKETPEFE